MSWYKTSMQEGVIPKVLYPLAREALKYNTFEEFENAYLGQIKHGRYYHITDNPNFTIDPEKGPRDMSSISSGEMSKGALMITSHLEYWAENYKNLRKYVAIIDMSNVDSKDYYQVNRGFGNEFFVKNPSKAKVEKVIPINQALKEDIKYNKLLPGSSENLRSFYEKVHAIKETQ